MAAVVAAGASVVVLAIRTHSALTTPLSLPTGIEGPPVHAIWKVQNGRPLYEAPDRPPYPLTLYNRGFYVTYAATLSAAGMHDDDMVTGGRLLTLLFAVAGAGLHWWMLGRCGGPGDRAGRTWAGASVVLTWFGAVTVWWPLSVRPDVPAMAMVTGATAAVLAWVRRPAGWKLATASVLFLAAWSFKQSAVLTAAGVGAWLVLGRRDLRAAAWLAAPFAIGAGAMFAAGDDAYVANVLVAPTLNQVILADGLKRLAETVVPNPLPFAFVPVAAWLLWSAGAVRSGESTSPSPPSSAEGAGPEGSPGPTVVPPASDVGSAVAPVAAELVPVAWAATVAGVAGFVALCKEGSSRNQLFEFLLLATTAAVLLWGRLRQAGPVIRRRGMVAAAVAAAGMAVMPVLQLAFPTGLGPRLHWRLRLATAEQTAGRQALARFVAGLPRPVLIEDDILGQPWHAGGGGEGTTWMPDHVYLGGAERTGRIREPARRVLAGGRFAAVLAVRGDPLWQAAVDAGWRPVPMPAGMEAPPSAGTGHPQAGMTLFLPPSGSRGGAAGTTGS